MPLQLATTNDSKPAKSTGTGDSLEGELVLAMSNAHVVSSHGTDLWCDDSRDDRSSAWAECDLRC
jgi:hypothetical protein